MRPNGDKVLTNCMAKVWPDGMNNPSPIRPNGDKSWPIVRVRPQSMTRRYDRYARGASASHKGPLQGARNGRTLAPSSKPAPLATRCTHQTNNDAIQIKTQSIFTMRDGASFRCHLSQGHHLRSWTPIELRRNKGARLMISHRPWYTIIARFETPQVQWPRQALQTGNNSSQLLLELRSLPVPHRDP